MKIVLFRENYYVTSQNSLFSHGHADVHAQEILILGEKKETLGRIDNEALRSYDCIINLLASERGRKARTTCKSDRCVHGALFHARLKKRTTVKSYFNQAKVTK